MLQRAGSNSYSWWWASHIRAKQSRWIDDGLQDVENKVKSVLKLIEEDADSFAKKAEMYYRRRPELIRSIQDIYNSHRALAEQLERVSGELQKANDTIATVFPDQVRYESLDEENEGSLKETLVDFSNLQKVILPQSQEKKATSSSAQKKQKLKKISPNMSKEKAREEIYKLQKEIIVLRMEKEFMKNSYLNGLAKYLDIEKTITELQEEVNGLQDESGAEIVIEDEETRVLMVVTALKSCEDLLVDLHEQRNRFTEDGRIERRRIKYSEEKLLTLKIDYDPDSPENACVPSSMEEYLEEEGCKLELQSVCDKFIENFKMGIDVNMLEFSEKIDELVVKVIDLESIASTHEAHVHGLRLEMDEFEKNLQTLEADGITSFGDNNDITDKLIYTGELLQRVKQTERGVQDEKNKFMLQFGEACSTFNGLSDGLQSPRKQDEVVSSESSLEQDLDRSTGSDQEKKASKRWNSSQDSNSSGYKQTVICEAANISVKEEESKECMKEEECKSVRLSCAENDDLVLPNWEQLFKDGMEDREKILLTEYTTILRNYKEAKRRLADEDKNIKDFHLETGTQIRELKNVIEMRDEQIKSLQQELKILQSSWNKSSDDETEVKASDNLEVVGNNNGEGTQSSVSEKQKENNAELSKTDRLKSEEVAAADDSEIKPIDEPQTLTSIEEKFRRDVDNLLEDNLQFWLRFTTCFDQIQKFQSKVEGLQADIEGLKGANKAETGTSTPTDAEISEKPEPSSIGKQLKDLEAEISTWVEENARLKEELQTKFSSLCSVKEEIVKASTEITEGEEQQLSGYQAARFNGEVLTMTRENNIVADKMGVGLDHVKFLREEVVKAIAVLEDSTDVSKGKSNGHHRSKNRSKMKSSSKSFLFNVKPFKPMKPLKFPCMKPHKKPIDVGTAVVP